MHKSSLILFFLFFQFIGYSKTIREKFDAGKEIEIIITPVEDAYSDPSMIHSLKIYKEKNLSKIKLKTTKGKYEKILTAKALEGVFTFLENWMAEKCKSTISCGLMYDIVSISVGIKKKTFRTSYGSDSNFLIHLFPDNDAD